MKSSTYYFHMKTNILTDFQICISLPFRSGCCNQSCLQIWLNAWHEDNNRKDSKQFNFFVVKVTNYTHLNLDLVLKFVLSTITSVSLYDRKKAFSITHFFFFFFLLFLLFYTYLHYDLFLCFSKDVKTIEKSLVKEKEK